MADLLLPNTRRARQFRRTNRQLDDFDDEELRRRYRFSGENIDRLVDLIGDRLKRQTRRNHPLTPRQQIMIALRFYASGCFLQLIGDTFGVDVATVSRVVTDVTDALFDLKNEYVRFPTTPDERQQVRKGMYRLRSFPNVIGAIDGTHVRIISPPKPEEADYVNRKRYHSINVQASCDHEMRITSLNASWPGSCHDAHVFRCSNICHYLEQRNQDIGGGVLLGDSGYACRPFLLTPYLHPITESQERFNTAHIATRNIIERMFGIWKRRFHVLHSEIRMKPRKASRIIVACAVLHNLAISWKEPEVEDHVEDQQPGGEPFNGQQDGRSLRDYFANTYFAI